jgi:hypothetical protein
VIQIAGACKIQGATSDGEDRRSCSRVAPWLWAMASGRAVAGRLVTGWPRSHWGIKGTANPASCLSGFLTRRIRRGFNAIKYFGAFFDKSYKSAYAVDFVSMSVSESSGRLARHQPSHTGRDDVHLIISSSVWCWPRLASFRVSCI